MFKLALLAYNIASALTGLAYADDLALRDAELKRLRFHLIHVAGRLSRSQCKMRLRFNEFLVRGWGTHHGRVQSAR
jgi:hypothetical protein